MNSRTSPAILIVEDEAVIAKDLQMSLGEMGYDAFATAASASEAMARAAVKPPDIVLMDIRIKGPMDGIELAEVLTSKFHPVIIYLTAHADDAMVERAKNTEPYGYLLKPVKLAELRSMIEISLYRRQLDRARAETAQLDSRLRSLTELNLQLASERDPRALLIKVCHNARQMFSATFAVLVVLEKAANALFCTTSGVDSRETARPPPVPPLDSGPLGRVYRQGIAWRCNAASGDDATQPLLPPGYPSAAAYLAVPICSPGRTYGWLCLANAAAAPFSIEDERLLVILAGQAGRIYENGSLYYDLQLHAAQLQVEMDERERAAADLRRSEERFRQLAETIQDVFFIFSPDFGELIYHSPAFEQIWGRPYDRANPMDWTTSIYVEDQPRILAQLARHAVKPAFDEFEFRIVRPNGSIRWIFSRHFPLYDDAGIPYRIVGVATDITERKLAEAKIEHLNRVYAVLSGINALIIRAQTRAELFEGSCHLAVEHGDFALAWIGWLDHKALQMTPLAWAGDGGRDRYLQENVSVSLDQEALEALQRQAPWVCNDLGSLRPTSAYQKDMATNGLHSTVILPLVIHGKTVGCLVLATDEPAAFDTAEMRLLCELAGDISFALDHIEKAEQLNYLAYYDSLTGLANRALFVQRLAQQVDAAKRNAAHFAVVVREPERFETINETFGRVQGDALLKEIAERLIRCTGDENSLARIGSDQFASVLPFAGEAGVAARVLDDQHEAWLALPFQVGTQDVKLSARAGIAIYPYDGTEAEMLLKNAEAALRRAGSLGDRTVFFTQEIGDRIIERLSMETRLRLALQHEEFVLHYQPKVDLETRELEGVEALIRWQSPDLGLVPPVKFIALMEETGMIIDVGTWVLRQACADRRRWLDAGLPAPRIAVNVSSVQLRRPDFLDVVRDAMKRATRQTVATGAMETGIDMEVTESLFVANVETNLEKLRALRKLGVGVAIDDFGTGYSSLGYLARMPVNSLKIDRTFIEAMLDDPGVMTLVSTIIALAHSLKLKVIAEGVESEEQAKILRLLRCDQMQGYLYSKPLPFEEMTKLLSRSVRAWGVDAAAP